MTTIYVFDNELLGDSGEEFAVALIDQHTAATQSECEAWFAENYNPNEYTSSYTAP